MLGKSCQYGGEAIFSVRGTRVGNENKMVTIADVAQHAGVSNGTISRYFHEPERVRVDTREKIRVAIEILGYTPNALARNFRMGNTGVVMVLTTFVGDPFYGDVVSGINRVAREKGYVVRIEEFSEKPLSGNDLNSFVQSRQADGIIVMGSPWPFKPGKKVEQQSQHAVVVCGETADPELMSYPRFQIDGRKASFELTQLLIGLGHTEIAFIGGSAESFNLKDREQGYRDAMDASGLSLEEEWIVYGELDMTSARSAINDLLQAVRRPSAIMCATDDMALGAMAELHSRGYSIPKDFSITGFDNTKYAEVANPPLTTIAQPAHEIGARAMTNLVRKIQGGAAYVGVEHLQHTMVVRQSTAAVIRL